MIELLSDITADICFQLEAERSALVCKQFRVELKVRFFDFGTFQIGFLSPSGIVDCAFSADRCFTSKVSSMFTVRSTEWNKFEEGNQFYITESSKCSRLSFSFCREL